MTDEKKSPKEVYDAIASKEAKAGSFCLLTLEKKKNLAVLCDGVGFAAFKEAFPEDKVAWGVINVHGVDKRANVESVRTKMVLVNWVGPNVPSMQKMQALSGKSKVAKIAKGAAVAVDASDPKEITIEVIAKELLACGGAHKPTFYKFGEEEGEKFDLNFYAPENK
eukprot:CAMPEP_0197519488 /NCGR_PEP_ID=MMETSP1318-20131121/4754_1 /TAXON_ID=552666 /ORGANISM="Partenskyella glossopodia, Strain RCC365" /LENGTH=165 /DNA_ID=CAMNT_0043070487 /DNA_START=14 /DNA_END=511 /DNA_ORIENTATION=-